MTYLDKLHVVLVKAKAQGKSLRVQLSPVPSDDQVLEPRYEDAVENHARRIYEAAIAQGLITDSGEVL